MPQFADLLIPPLTGLAFVSYLATLALGVTSLRGHRMRRVWHTRLYIVTFSLTVIAVAVTCAGAGWRGVVLGLALIPLALLPWVSSASVQPIHRRPAPHIVVGASAAPFYLAALALLASDWRPDGIS